jgi:glucoamylase
MVVALAAAGPAAAAPAPGGPGERTSWSPADKQGFGTAVNRGSKVWHTLRRGALSEVYYPDLGTPSVRAMEFVVTDGRTFTDRETDVRSRVSLADPKSLTYEQVTGSSEHGWRLHKTWVTDPGRDTLLLRLRFESRRRGLKLYLVYDPALANTGDDDSARSAGATLLASDGKAASALVADPAPRATSNGFLGASDGWTDLADHRLDGRYSEAANGNVVQTALTGLTGRRDERVGTVALGFGADEAAARSAARGSLAAGFGRVAGRYAHGWDRYLSGLRRTPRSARGLGPAYAVSVMVLAASEDKTFSGASIASPSMPWAWGDGETESPSGPYHLVWSRDLYQVATAQIAAGDREAALRSLRYLFERQQKPDGSFPQNSEVDGTQRWENLQLDEVGLPIVLAWQLREWDPATWRDHVRPAAEFLLATGPVSPQERWENQSGYSPATIAAEVAGLVTAADIARRNGATADARRYLATADDWRERVDDWTLSTNGPLSARPYYLRVTKDGNPDAPTTYAIGDSGPSAMDQRRVVDPSFLELVRLGLKRPDDPGILGTLPVVDRELKVTTPNGAYWHRFSFDGYGETEQGEPWEIGEDDTFRTFGRAWPLLAGERGEYELAAGRPAARRLRALAAAGNKGHMIAEQVWDARAPSGRPGFEPGEGTFSATPLAWSHAQLVRLAWSIDAGRPVETPRIVACRYVRSCRR